MFMLAGSSSGSSRLELTELKLGQYSSPSIATASACCLKTTSVTVLCNTNVLSANKLGVVLGFGQLTVWLLVYEQTPTIRPEALDVTYKH